MANLRALDGGALLSRALAGLAREIAYVECTLPARLAAGDAPASRRLSHRLAGACDVLGAALLAERLRAFEILTEFATPAALQGALAELAPVLQATGTETEKLAAVERHTPDDTGTSRHLPPT